MDKIEAKIAYIKKFPLTDDQLADFDLLTVSYRQMAANLDVTSPEVQVCGVGG